MKAGLSHSRVDSLDVARSRGRTGPGVLLLGFALARTESGKKRRRRVFQLAFER